MIGTFLRYLQANAMCTEKEFKVADNDLTNAVRYFANKKENSDEYIIEYLRAKAVEHFTDGVTRENSKLFLKDFKTIISMCHTMNLEDTPIGARYIGNAKG